MAQPDEASKAEIREVVQRYCRGADRLDWEAVRACFHPDARDEHGLYDGDIDGMISFFSRWSAETYVSAMHMVGNQIVDLFGDQAICESYCTSYLRLEVAKARRAEFARLFEAKQLEAVLADATSGFVDLTIGVRFLDRFERRSPDLRWLIAHRVVLLEWDRLDPVRSHTKTPVRTGRRDASDLMFEWVTSLRQEAPSAQGAQG